MVYDVVVIGGGPAGCTAALYAKRSGLKTLLIEKGIIGGYIVNARSLENYPGFSSISGMDFGSKLSEQLKGFDVELMPDEVVQLSLKGEIKEVSTREKKIQTKTVILASGTEHRKLGIKGEAEFIGRGVSFCATCDAPFYRDRKVAVIGGGNSAVDEALTISEMASTVYLIHRRDMLRAEQVRCEQLAEKGEHLTHHQRFALATFLLNIGMDIEDVLNIFRNLPDFNERIARYQVEHLAGIRGGRKKYLVYSCEKMRTLGLCNSSCDVKNPLVFYWRTLKKLGYTRSKRRFSDTKS